MGNRIGGILAVFFFGLITLAIIVVGAWDAYNEGSESNIIVYGFSTAFGLGTIMAVRLYYRDSNRLLSERIRELEQEPLQTGPESMIFESRPDGFSVDIGDISANLQIQIVDVRLYHCSLIIDGLDGISHEISSEIDIGRLAPYEG